jgi:hypothetical protein
MERDKEFMIRGALNEAKAIRFGGMNMKDHKEWWLEPLPPKSDKHLIIKPSDKYVMLMAKTYTDYTIQHEDGSIKTYRVYRGLTEDETPEGSYNGVSILTEGRIHEDDFKGIETFGRSQRF